MASTVRVIVALGLAFQRGAEAADDCISVFKSMEETCNGLLKKGMDACKDSNCTGPMMKAKEICTNNESYWDSEQNDMVDVAGMLEVMMTYCQDPCLSQFIQIGMQCGVDEGEGEMSCEADCVAKYAGLLADPAGCDQTVIPDDDGKTIGQGLSGVEMMCDPCIGSFLKFSDDEKGNCFNMPCSDTCTKLMGHIYEHCDNTSTVFNPETSTTYHILTFVGEVRKLMADCITTGGDDEGCPASEHIEGIYAVGQSGNAKCPCGYTYIKDFEKCKMAAMALKSKYDDLGDVNGRESWDGPIGCHFQDGSNFQFNEKFDGERARAGGHTLVCQKDDGNGGNGGGGGGGVCTSPVNIPKHIAEKHKAKRCHAS